MYPKLEEVEIVNVLSWIRLSRFGTGARASEDKYMFTGFTVARSTPDLIPIASSSVASE